MSAFIFETRINKGEWKNVDNFLVQREWKIEF